MGTPITASQIKELRDRTGVGMGKCKEALEEANGDMELAIANLRKSGMASAVKKEGRAANEGIIGSAETAQVIALVEVNTETDFVAKNERFIKFVADIANEVAQTMPSSIDTFLKQKFSKDPSLTVDEYRAILVQTLGENIQVKRLALFKKDSNKSLGVYSHLGGKIVTLVEIAGSNQEEELAKDIAMHVAAAAPEYVAPENVPASVLTQEKEILTSQIQGKPANILDKILDGKIKAYYDAVCLICQKYIRDDSLTVAEVVKQKSPALKITHFIRWGLGQ